MVKNLPANAGDVRDVVLIPRSGRSPGGGSGNPLYILVWRILWTEEPGRLQPMGSHRQTQLKGLSNVAFEGKKINAM